MGSRKLAVTGAPVICATVLQWAPSRVTRRGAPATTAAAAAAPSPSPPTSLSLFLPLSLTTLSSRRAPRHAGIPTMGTHGRVAASLLHKIHLRSFRLLLPNGSTDDPPLLYSLTPPSLPPSFSHSSFLSFFHYSVRPSSVALIPRLNHHRAFSYVYLLYSLSPPPLPPLPFAPFLSFFLPKSLLFSFLRYCSQSSSHILGLTNALSRVLSYQASIYRSCYPLYRLKELTVSGSLSLSPLFPSFFLFLFISFFLSLSLLLVL